MTSHLVGVHGDLILLHDTTESADLRDARRAEQLALDDPVLDAPQVGQGVAVLISARGVNLVLIDLAESGRDGRHLRRADRLGDVLGRHAQSFLHLLSSPVQLDVLVEDDGDNRQPEARERAHVLNARNAHHTLFDRERDELLDLLRRQAGCLSNDHHLVIRDVRYGIDRQARERVRTPPHEGERHQGNDQLSPDREQDDGI